MRGWPNYSEDINIFKVFRFREANAIRVEARYLAEVRRSVPPDLDLTGLRLCLDCAHGATYRVAPRLFRALGADVVLHSTTKYIEGHNATLGGALLVREPELRARLDLVRKSLGTIQSPLEAWLTLRGLKTLELRLERCSASALAIARWLERHPKVARVHYPGLPSHPQHERAKKLLQGFGGVLSFELKGDARAADALLRRFRLLVHTVSLGETQPRHDNSNEETRRLNRRVEVVPDDRP